MMYAEDTRNEKDLQRMLDAYNIFCKMWILTVNEQTKIVLFGCIKKDYKTFFKLFYFYFYFFNILLKWRM